MNPWIRLRDLVVGTALEIGDAGELLLTGARHLTGTAALQQRLAEVAERGAAGSLAARRRGAAAVDAAITALATSAIVDRVVDAQLDRVLRPVVRGILDDVLELLEREPDRIQALVRGQRDTMVDELVGRIRTGAAAGDSAVDRLTARVLHREIDGR
ncbi:hypothetical protein [Paractinoplanes rishiriensis]|uniref:Uncharacterized protein n=1 Tax=Paractinoplanes rishiriensis TaxID=1050105 RepID=A0A919MXG1_9ACTN|nr:hypothetical protein [Actinoplanes rishiriensis]GIE98499.1 hypothetical protein Ari01nite_59640 [Actinoplanes rishiriensis]